jgi:hypothetical protein
MIPLLHPQTKSLESFFCWWDLVLDLPKHFVFQSALGQQPSYSNPKVQCVDANFLVPRISSQIPAITQESQDVPTSSRHKDAHA